MPRSSLTVAVVLGGIAIFSVGVKSRLLENRSTTALKVKEVAPGFRLSDTHGAHVELTEVAMHNTVVLVSFWATWCGPCRIELANLEKLYKEKTGRGFEILAINEDRDPEKLAEYLKEKPLSFPVLVDTDGDVAKTYGVQAFPTSALLDAKGRVLSVFDGLQPYLGAMVEYSLKTKPSDG